MAGQARTQPDEADSSDDEGAPLGVPVNETRSWRRLARQRLAKACHFMVDSECQFSTALWGVLTGPVMVIHYSLFKRYLAFRARPS